MTRLAAALLTVVSLGATVPPPSRPPAPPLPLKVVSGGLPPLPAMTVVAECESGGNLTAKNPTSTASGLYQFLDSTWEWVTGLPAPASAHPKPVQDWAFRRLWADGAGASHWFPSKHCWGPLLAVNP